jgi:hypothetical protein
MRSSVLPWVKKTVFSMPVSERDQEIADRERDCAGCVMSTVQQVIVYGVVISLFVWATWLLASEALFGANVVLRRSLSVLDGPDDHPDDDWGPR